MIIAMIRQKYLRPFVLQFLRDERGAALTEMAISLPVWILMLGGIITLGKLGMNTTANQLNAQTDLWNGVLEVSSNEDTPDGNSDTGSDQWVHFTPVSGGGAAAYQSGELALDDSNPHKVVTGTNAVVMGPTKGLALSGTLGESYWRTLPLQAVPGNDIPEISTNPDDILKVGSSYPKKVTYDGLIDSSTDYNTDGGWLSTVTNAIGNVMASAGMVGSLGAGIRYGEVYTESETDISVMFSGNVPASAHANILVAPKPLTGDNAKWRPFLMNRLLAGGEPNYAKMMRFGGDASWDAEGEPDMGDFDPEDLEDLEDKAEDKAEEEEEEGGG